MFKCEILLMDNSNPTVPSPKYILVCDIHITMTYTRVYRLYTVYTAGAGHCQAPSAGTRVGALGDRDAAGA